MYTETIVVLHGSVTWAAEHCRTKDEGKLVSIFHQLLRLLSHVLIPLSHLSVCKQTNSVDTNIPCKTLKNKLLKEFVDDAIICE